MDFEKLGLTLNELFRYMYGGLLLGFIAALIEPQWIGEQVKLLGTVILALLSLGLGAALYAGYRNIFGELLLFPLADLFHRGFQFLWGYRQGRGHNCKLHWLQIQHGVMCRNTLIAWRLIRWSSDVFEEAARHRFDLWHAEIHLLYLTFTVLFGGFLYVWWKDGLTPLAWRFFLIALVSLIPAIWGDMTVCRTECAYVLGRDQKKIRELLDAAQLLRR